MTYQEILNACNSERFHSSTRQLLACVAIDIAELSSKYPRLDAELNTIAMRMRDLGDLMDAPNCPTPSDYFELIGFGHFKECFCFSPSLVIKFCAERNPTDEEEKALQDAFANDLDFLFLPTFYYELPHCLSSTELEKDDEDYEVYDEETSDWVKNPEWEDNTLITHMCIQLTAETAEVKYFNPKDNYLNKLADAECGIHGRSWTQTREVIGLPGNASSDDYEGLNGICLLWARDLAQMYGIDALRRFSDFCVDYHIWDLHSSNVGYVSSGRGAESVPVIMDWMSR